MNVTTLAALAIAIPVVLLPAALIWYINIGGIVLAIRDAKAARRKKAVAKAAA